MKTVTNYLCELAEEEAIRASELKQFKVAKKSLEMAENVIASHFSIVNDQVKFDTDFDEIEIEILRQFIAEKI